MSGETELGKLLAGMQPALRGRDWGFAVGQAPDGVTVFATVAEDEGQTLIARFADLHACGLNPQGPMARISLSVHSSLSAVGLTAAIATALAAKGISANVVAGFFHDHFFVAAADADRAMDILQGLSDV